MRFTRANSKRVFMDMTPMIDVTLQLIIFFMFTSQFVEGSRTPLDLPKQLGSQLQEGQTPALVVDVLADGSLIVDGTKLAPTGLGQQVQQAIVRAGGQADRVRVLVRADKLARSNDINVVARTLAAFGVRGWQLGTAGEVSGAASAQTPPSTRAGGTP
jgi:biopolymer transport protein ExbD